MQQCQSICTYNSTAVAGCKPLLLVFLRQSAESHWLVLSHCPVPAAAAAAALYGTSSKAAPCHGFNNVQHPPVAAETPHIAGTTAPVHPTPSGLKLSCSPHLMLIICPSLIKVGPSFSRLSTASAASSR